MTGTEANGESPEEVQMGALIALGLSVVILGTPRVVSAQTEKVNVQTTAEGETVQTPYITYEEFQAASLDASGGGKTHSKEAAGGTVTLGGLVSVSSLDEVTHLLGKPEDVSHGSPYGKMVLAYINYDGMRIEYVNWDKNDPDSSLELRELHLKSSNWSFTINGTKLRPGMEVSQLSPAVQKALNEDFDPSVDAFGSIVITKPGAATQAEQGGKLERMRGGASIQIEVNAGTVELVRFQREI